MSYFNQAILRFSKLVSNQVQKDLRKEIMIHELSKCNRKNEQSIINQEKRADRIIVSLTSYGARVSEVFLTIESLGEQSLLADEIVLWLSKTEFENRTLPYSLERLKDRGLKVRFCDDFRSFKKLVPAINEYPNDIIITVDDDVIYNSNLILGLYSAYKQDPMSISCYRGHLMQVNDGRIAPYSSWIKRTGESPPSHQVMATGVGGVLYFPGCFNKDVSLSSLFMRLCPTADDIWFKFMALIKGTKYRVIPSVSRYDENIVLDHALIDDLGKINVAGKGNDLQVRNIVSHYKIDIDNFLK